jgi:CheY-like chemotaxis protein
MTVDVYPATLVRCAGGCAEEGGEHTAMHVLVVDDDLTTRLLLDATLSKVGYTVTTVASGMEALAWLYATPTQPCVILLDVLMPGMTGWEFLARLRADAALAAIPVVVITGAVERALGGAHPEVVAVIAKPIDVGSLLTAVARCCAG